MKPEKHEGFVKREEEAVKKISKTYSEKYPFLFAMGGAFGLVSTFYGFEKLIDRVDLFADNPWILLGTGLGLLIVTGTFYNRLQ